MSEVHGFEVFADFIYVFCALLRFQNWRAICIFLTKSGAFFSFWLFLVVVLRFQLMENIQGVLCGLIIANTSPVPYVSSLSKSDHAFFGHKLRNQKYLCLACWLLAIFFSCSFMAFAKISCGDAVSGTPLTPPVGGNGFFPPLKRECFAIARREVSLDFDLEN